MRAWRGLRRMSRSRRRGAPSSTSKRKACAQERTDSRSGGEPAEGGTSPMRVPAMKSRSAWRTGSLAPPIPRPVSPFTKAVRAASSISARIGPGRPRIAARPSASRIASTVAGSDGVSASGSERRNAISASFITADQSGRPPPASRAFHAASYQPGEGSPAP